MPVNYFLFFECAIDWIIIYFWLVFGLKLYSWKVNTKNNTARQFNVVTFFPTHHKGKLR